jgi:hypothetical protein
MFCAKERPIIIPLDKSKTRSTQRNLGVISNNLLNTSKEKYEYEMWCKHTHTHKHTYTHTHTFIHVSAMACFSLVYYVDELDDLSLVCCMT